MCSLCIIFAIICFAVSWNNCRAAYIMLSQTTCANKWPIRVFLVYELIRALVTFSIYLTCAYWGVMQFDQSALFEVCICSLLGSFSVFIALLVLTIGEVIDCIVLASSASVWLCYYCLLIGMFLFRLRAEVLQRKRTFCRFAGFWLYFIPEVVCAVLLT